MSKCWLRRWKKQVARAEIKIPEEFLLKLSHLGEHTDEVLKKVLDAGGKVVEEKVHSTLTAAIRTDRSTGELAGALGVSPAKLDRNGNFNVKIGFSEPRSGGKANAMIAGVLEYGKHGQPPRPFMKPAMSSSKADAIRAMEDVYDREVDNL